MPKNRTVRRHFCFVTARNERNFISNETAIKTTQIALLKLFNTFRQSIFKQSCPFDFVFVFFVANSFQSEIYDWLLIIILFLLTLVCFCT